MNTINLSDLQQQTQEIKEHIARYEATHEPSQFRVFPRAMEAIAEYGAENIFLVSEVYHGMYHDDYAYFEYYNNVTGETFKDQWTTAFCCPAYQFYKCVTIEDAWECGFVNAEKWLKSKKEELLAYLSAAAIPHIPVAELIKAKALVSVRKGRKWQGTGYIIKKRDMKFGYKSVTYAIIFDPMTMTINEVNADYVQIEDMECLEKMWKQECKDMITALQPSDVVVSNGRIETGCKVDFISWLTKRNEGVILDYSEASWPAQEARDKKASEFKEKKMAELVEWVKTNTDRKGDDIQALAERIFARRYA
jgi:hypothetical protein